MNINLSKISRILIIQYEPFGDVLLNTGYLPSLKEKFPDAKIDFLVKDRYKLILEDNPYINELVIISQQYPYFLHFSSPQQELSSCTLSWHLFHNPYPAGN